jgi:protease I
MTLKGKRIAILVDDGFEDLEFWVPLMRMEEGGAEVTVVGSKAGRVVHSKSGGLTASIDCDAAQVGADDFDGVIVPGGWAPDKLRRSEAVVRLVRALHDNGKFVAMICHAGLVGISAGIVKGHRATGSLGIRDDLVNAGATWVDAPAFRDGSLIWGRVVPDIPAFCRELVAALEKGG